MSSTHGDSTLGQLDPKYLQSLRSLEPALVREVVGEFLGTAPEQLSELRQATRAADACSIRSIAHKLRGSSGLLGAVGLSAALATVESLGRAGDLAQAPRALELLELEFAAVRPVLEAAAAA
jgi:HPt (histidine-containing phosphotransfer) domain-containing protein